MFWVKWDLSETGWGKSGHRTNRKNISRSLRAVERWTVYRGDGGSIPPTGISKLKQFRSSHICLCLSEETLKVGGPFCLVSMTGEVKGPTQGLAQVWAVMRKPPET